MSEMSCPVSGRAGGMCPVGAKGNRSRSSSRLGPRGCSFSGFCQPGDIHAAFDIPKGVDAEEWLRTRERKSINAVLYNNVPMPENIRGMKNVDDLNADMQDVLAVALGAPARQVMIRAEEIGPATGWRDGYLSAEHGFCIPDYNEAPGVLAASPGRIWSDLAERMPGCVARGRVRESIAALPIVEGTEDVIPDRALWAALVCLGMLCHIYRFEDKYDGSEGVSTTGGDDPSSTMTTKKWRPDCEMGDDLGDEFIGIPRCVALPYWQVSRRCGRAIPHQTFFDQSSFNIKIRDPTSTQPYVGRFDNTDLRWPMFGEKAEIAFLKGCADTSASFQHGPDAIAACQEAVMNRDVEALLREMVRLKEILERMPNAFHSISVNPNSGENFVPGPSWVRWAKFSAPLSKRCPAASGLQFPPYLVMDAFLGRKDYGSFLGAEGIHLRAWLPSNLRAFIAAIELHYRVPEFVKQSGDPRLLGVLDGIVEAYTGERGFMGVHRYKVFGILEVAGKTGRSETNGASGAGEAQGRPWEQTHQQFSDAMKERLKPFRGEISVEPHEMRGTFEECRWRTRILSRSWVDSDPNRTVANVTLDLHNTGITFQPGDRLAVMPLNSYAECAKVIAALGIDFDTPVDTSRSKKWMRFAKHLGSVSQSNQPPQLTVKHILRRGHLSPITKELALKVHDMLRASSRTVLQVLATDEWPVRGSLGDLLQGAVTDTPPQIWDRAFSLGEGGEGDDGLAWLADLVEVEVPRTYSISSYPTDELLPSTVDLTVSRAEHVLASIFSNPGGTSSGEAVVTAGVSSGFLNPFPQSPDEVMPAEEDILIGISRPVAFQLPLDRAAPVAYFAGGSGIAPFRSFWQARMASGGARANAVGRDILYLGVQSREKFCYEEELREYVDAGLLEVHVAFSRDSRGLAYNKQLRDLVEVEGGFPPRYINALIEEQGPTVCDLLMSKKHGGLGGYMYVCGSVAVFDSVMAGIRKAIYNCRTTDPDTAEMILSRAFAERRFMLDIFMSPKAIPCNLPTIPLSQLARNTGHRPGGRIWVGVHGSVYDVTDFCPMHPGGTFIIKSNAGVDCSRSFDMLAHTNNPEVSSLLTKYFIGHLSPKPEFRGTSGDEQLSPLYDLWKAYLRTAVETLVAHQFEVNEISEADSRAGQTEIGPRGTTNLWVREGLFSVIGVRAFYAYQSRLLQGGFAALFGPKVQELVLKLSFAIASGSGGDESGGPDARLPDVLGIIARAKTSRDAVKTSQEVAQVGQFVSEDAVSARFRQRGIVAYAARSVELDIELLEDIREEACRGMDAFDSILTTPGLDMFPGQRVSALCSFLLQTLERMAKRLEVFYAKLAQCSVTQPEIEQNPARTRWHLVRQQIRDGSFFVLTRDLVLGTSSSRHMGGAMQPVGFDAVMSHVEASIRNAGPSQMMMQNRAVPTTMNAVHLARAATPPHALDLGASAAAAQDNNAALRSMSSFIDSNRKTIRRLSKMPVASDLGGGAGPITFEQLQAQFGSGPMHQQKQMMTGGGGVPTPPSSRGSSRSPSRMRETHPHTGYGGRQGTPFPGQNMRGRSPAGVVGGTTSPRYYSLPVARPPQPTGHAPPTPPVDAGAALSAMMSALNVRRRQSDGPPGSAMGLGIVGGGGPTSVPSSPYSVVPGSAGLGTNRLSGQSAGSYSMQGMNRRRTTTGAPPRTGGGGGHRPSGSTNSLRAFKLRAVQEVAGGGKIAPTF